ncbi:xylulokinase [Conexibacter woesei]|uniref:Carbohydrate kinase, FGGY-like protein n=1 Tax=Conexibacter woesei (strain DSM 14684 / CCUG 47730 / CIP 108061 / JCM 11494 / NBRC 100937 / ID131577) TaxID=469383 RepID=D3FBY3_CONWI|nr:FGGY family carbohydrate kinase [Conexibacter woesei]ADB51398.1 Carbohydrate kinase, FGGY-like protein [Conexibacter woesei DSM 14684]
MSERQDPVGRALRPARLGRADSLAPADSLASAAAAARPAPLASADSRASAAAAARPAPLVLGLDVGTSSVKALVLDGDGEVVESRSAPHALTPTPGAVEADPRGWWKAAQTAVGSLQTDPGSLVAVGLSGNMSSVVLLDASGEPLRPAPLLADPRGAEELEALDGELREALAASSRNPVNAISPLASLLWLAAHEPATLDATAVWVSAKDYVRLQLTGELASDSSDAHNSLVHDPVAREWQRELIARVGLPVSIFPPLRDGGASGGTVTATAAALTGLREGTPVAIGGADMATAALGSGAVERGTLALSLGTSVTALAPLGAGAASGAAGAAGVDAFADAWRGKLTYHPPPGDGGAYALASLLTGGLALNWLRALCGGTVPLPTAEDTVPDAADPLVFVPQLAGAGSPDFEPRLRGALLGVGPHAGGEQIAAALFEAIAFELAGIVELLGPESVQTVRATGGGANIDAWVQTIADVLGTPVDVLAHHDVSAIGAALLAREAIGAPLPPERVGRVARRFEPRREHAAAWQARAERYAEARALALAYARHEAPGADAPAPAAPGAPAPAPPAPPAASADAPPTSQAGPGGATP